MRPYVIINAAMSADGKLSTRERRQVRISGSDDFARVDRMRAECDAILVGIGTVQADDPSLTVKSPDLRSARRREGRPENPIRIVLDSHARTPITADILVKGEGERIIAVAEDAEMEKIRALAEHAMIISCGKGQVDLPYLLNKLSESGIETLMIEGGGTVIWSFLSEGLFDELITYIGSCIIGGAAAPTLADGEGFIDETRFPRLHLEEVQRIDDGLLIRWKRKVDG